MLFISIRNRLIITQIEVMWTHNHMPDFHVEVPERCMSDVVVLTARKDLSCVYDFPFSLDFRVVVAC